MIELSSRTHHSLSISGVVIVTSAHDVDTIQGLSYTNVPAAATSCGTLFLQNLLRKWRSWFLQRL